jgi:hypothetical protein
MLTDVDMRIALSTYRIKQYIDKYSYPIFPEVVHVELEVVL